ncbi:hypothetical protein L211DRAFT_817583 [Terfezia boudieri ATCC MYA-4762]|uniref:PNT domain-containing protein n=1 Tax=Terfezia boudieri ATCC MYA-4762 TaxID=1051890 RepID=A0A3N4MAJ3_9PEZI|nr:hypothetical protein L211DRAFT_817583 [Terfezia boudieri ATCC MYA-4762]
MKPPPTSDPCPSQPLPENPEQWSPAHVLKYLEEKQVEYYLTDVHIAKFREQEIAGSDLLTLTKKDLGQPPFDFSHGPAIRIERLINVLRNLQALCNKHAVTIVVSTHPSTSRERRWGDLNPILNAVLNQGAKNDKKTEKKTGSVAYSNVTWPDVEPIFERLFRDVTIEPAEVPQNILQGLQSYLSIVTTGLGDAITGNEQKRILLIAPILFYILKAFRDSGVSDMKILVERSVPGKNINVNGKFEFIIQRGEKRICVVEAKIDDMDQGMTQDLLGCEAIADVENSSCVYGIVTNYRDWLFFRSLDDKIERDSLTLAMTGPGGYLPSEEGLKGIVGKIYALLSE